MDADGFLLRDPEKLYSWTFKANISVIRLPSAHSFHAQKFSPVIYDL